MSHPFALRRLMKILSLDYGDKRIGLALGDAQAGVAVPYGILENQGRTYVLHQLKVLIKKEDIGKVLIGIPLALHRERNADTMRLKDVVNAQMQKVLRFIDDVRNAVTIFVETIDERLSTREADNRTKGQKKSDIASRDAIAATIILQNYLDKSEV